MRIEIAQELLHKFLVSKNNDEKNISVETLLPQLNNPEKNTPDIEKSIRLRTQRSLHVISNPENKEIYTMEIERQLITNERMQWILWEMERQAEREESKVSGNFFHSYVSFLHHINITTMFSVLFQ